MDDEQKGGEVVKLAEEDQHLLSKIPDLERCLLNHHLLIQALENVKAAFPKELESCNAGTLFVGGRAIGRRDGKYHQVRVRAHLDESDGIYIHLQRPGGPLESAELVAAMLRDSGLGDAAILKSHSDDTFNGGLYLKLDLVGEGTAEALAKFSAVTPETLGQRAQGEWSAWKSMMARTLEKQALSWGIPIPDSGATRGSIHELKDTLARLAVVGKQLEALDPEVAGGFWRKVREECFPPELSGLLFPELQAAQKSDGRPAGWQARAAGGAASPRRRRM